MEKRILALMLGSALVCAGCKQAQMESSATTAGAQPDVTAALPQVQATHAAVAAATSAPARAGQGGAATPQRFPALLASERSVVEGSGLSVAKVSQFIKTPRFGDFVSRLATEAAADPLAQDLTQAERTRWQQKLQGQASLDAFACGLSVCAGSIALGTNTALYDAIADDYLNNGSQGGSLLDYRVDLGNGNFEQRFVMSVDPAVNGITFDGRPPVKR